MPDENNALEHEDNPPQEENLPQNDAANQQQALPNAQVQEQDQPQEQPPNGVVEPNHAQEQVNEGIHENDGENQQGEAQPQPDPNHPGQVPQQPDPNAPTDEQKSKLKKIKDSSLCKAIAKRNNANFAATAYNPNAMGKTQKTIQSVTKTVTGIASPLAESIDTALAIKDGVTSAKNKDATAEYARTRSLATKCTSITRFLSNLTKNIIDSVNMANASKGPKKFFNKAVFNTIILGLLDGYKVVTSFLSTKALNSKGMKITNSVVGLVGGLYGAIMNIVAIFKKFNQRKKLKKLQADYANNQNIKNASDMLSSSFVADIATNTITCVLNATKICTDITTLVYTIKGETNTKLKAASSFITAAITLNKSITGGVNKYQADKRSQTEKKISEANHQSVGDMKTDAVAPIIADIDGFTNNAGTIINLGDDGDIQDTRNNVDAMITSYNKIDNAMDALAVSSSNFEAAESLAEQNAVIRAALGA